MTASSEVCVHGRYHTRHFSSVHRRSDWVCQMDIKADISNRPLRAKIGSQLKQPRGKQKRSQSRMPVIVARFDQRRAVAPATPTRRTNAKGSRIPGCEHGLRHAGRAAHADGRAKQDACSARACRQCARQSAPPLRRLLDQEHDRTRVLAPDRKHGNNVSARLSGDV